MLQKLGKVSTFINRVAPMFTKYAKQHGFKIVSFAIAQACLESGYGTSNDARANNNILGIGPHKHFSSWDACVKGYYTITVLGKSKRAREAKTLDQYYQAFVASGYLGGNGQAAYYANVKSIIRKNNLTKYDNGKVVGGTNVLEAFVQKAISYNGTTESQWYRNHPHEPWCADFVCQCAKDVGILNKVIEKNPSAQYCLSSVTKYGGKIHKKGSYVPQRGDLVNFNWHGGTFAEHIGIVVSYKNGTLRTVEGNTSGVKGQQDRVKVQNREMKCVTRFGTPNWSKVGGFVDSDSAGSGPASIQGNLFEESNTRKDAILREAAYFDTEYKQVKNHRVVKSYKPTAKKQDISLSIINYTKLFSTFWDLGVAITNVDTGSDGSTTYDFSKLSSKVRNVVKALCDKGLNRAAACGIAGNIFYESGFDPGNIGDYGTSFGLCQWHNERGKHMKQMAGKNWATNVSGQIDYLWWELENGYKSVLNVLRNVKDTEDGCRKAADEFVRHFEVPQNVDSQSAKRQAKAVSYFKKIAKIVTSKTSDFSSVDIKNLSNKRQAIINAAVGQVKAKTPYVWGGSTPGKALDCSGLTQYCYRKAGISLPHQSEAQRNAAPHKRSPSKAVIGDILWRPGHVGIYYPPKGTIEEYGRGHVCEVRTKYSPSNWKLALHWDI